MKKFFYNVYYNIVILPYYIIVYFVLFIKNYIKLSRIKDTRERIIKTMLTTEERMFPIKDRQDLELMKKRKKDLYESIQVPPSYKKDYKK